MSDQETRLILDAQSALPFMHSVDGAPVLCLPPGWSQHDLSTLLDRPRRISIQEQFRELTGWIEYVNRFKHPESSIVFVRMSSAELAAEARLDYHGAGEPSWCQHTARFTTAPTPAWAAWAAQDGKFMRQSEFADFLYQNQREVTDPAGASLLEIITTLKATAAGEFRETRDDFSGSSELIYRMKVSAQGGTTDRPLSLPQHFQVALVPFYGCPFLLLKADLRVRAPTKDGDPLLLGFKFYRLDDELQGLGQSIKGLIATQTGLPVWS